MKWTIDQEPINGIMFRGQSAVRVKNRKGETGVARVQYYPVSSVVAPVLEVVPTDGEGYPVREPEVIDHRPTFAYPGPRGAATRRDGMTAMVSATNVSQRFPATATFAPISDFRADNGVVVYGVYYMEYRVGHAVAQEDRPRLTDRDVRVLLQR